MSGVEAPTLNQRWAARLIGTLVAAGLRDVVVAPGSRSTPLAVAAAENPSLRCVSVFDERAAGFVALGLSKASGLPVATLCTSGTAGAHFLPAVIEASESGHPLVVLTADRPWELQGFGAAQTIDQSALFSRFVRCSELLPSAEESTQASTHLTAVVARAVSLSQGPRRGPVHLNVPFREPLAPTVPGVPVTVTLPRFHDPEGLPALDEVRRALEGSTRCLVVCGPRDAQDGFGEAVHALAVRWGMPVLAEAASNARYGFSGAISMYDAMLRSHRFAHSMRPEVVLRFGLGTTPKSLQRWLDESKARIFCFSDFGQPVDPEHRAEAFLTSDSVEICRALSGGAARSTDYQQQFARAQQTAAGALDRLGDALDEPKVAAELVAALPPESNLVVSSSMPIRDVDAFAVSSKGRLRVFSNRGVNGIDGVISTALGVALDDPARRTSVLIGDVATLHDLNALVLARALGVDLTIVVVNNDGGGIFSFLPIAEKTTHFERLFATPHGLDFVDAARLAGARYHRPDTVAAFRAALAGAGRQLIEVRTNRQENVESHRRHFERLVSAVEVG